MSYRLRRIEDGKYVARAGSPKSYTASKSAARAFKTKEEAERERCGNERIEEN